MVPAVGKVNRDTDEQPNVSRSQLSTGKENINKRQEAMPSGSLRRMMSTAVLTMVNARSAPIFTSSASMRGDSSAAIRSTIVPIKMVDFQISISETIDCRYGRRQCNAKISGEIATRAAVRCGPRKKNLIDKAHFIHDYL